MKKVCSLVGILQLGVAGFFIFTPHLHAQRAATSSKLVVAPIEMTQVELSAAEEELIPEGLRAVPLYAPEVLPFSGNFYSLQHTNYPPFPGNLHGLPCWPLGDRMFLMNDVTFDYQASKQQELEAKAVKRSVGKTRLSDMPSFGGGGGSSFEYQGRVFTSNELWLEITQKTNATGYFVIHPPWNETNSLYDLFMTTNLSAYVQRLNLTNWAWLLRTESGKTNLTATNLTDAIAFFRLGVVSDSDDDGLTDAFENLVSHSLPTNTDTDGDGWADGVEILMGTDPTVSDLPHPSFAVTALNPQASEGGTNGQFLISRLVKFTNSLSVYYEVSGSAENGGDYDFLPGEAKFASGQSNTVISVVPVDDSEFEGAETVVLRLLPDFRYALGAESNATVTISDNDKPTVSVTADFSSAIEGGTNVGRCTVFRSGNLTNNLTVAFSLTGTATNGVQYTLVSTNLTIGASSNFGFVLIAPYNDTNYSGARSVVLTLQTNVAYLISNNAAIAVITIADDEKPTVQVLADDADAREGTPVRDGRFKFIRSQAVSEPLTVAFSIHGTATPGVATTNGGNGDYLALTNMVTIPAGSNTVTLAVHPFDDSTNEFRETVIAVLRGSSDYQIGVTNAATVFIDDNESTAYEWEVLTASAVGETDINLPAEIVVRRRGSTLTNAAFQLGFSDSNGWFIPPVDCVLGEVSNNAAPFLPASLLRYWVVFTNRSSEARILVNRVNSFGVIGGFPQSVSVVITNLFGGNSQQLYFHGYDRLLRAAFLTNQITEGATGAVLRITRNWPSAWSPAQPGITIELLVDGVATPGVDCNLTSPLAVALGNAKTNDILIQATADALSEGYESVFARLNLLATNYRADTRPGSNWVAALNIKDAGNTGPATPLDSDGDGMGDSFELANGGNPFQYGDPYADSDGDGLSDVEEAAAGSNPHARDTDGDGLDDYAEWTHGSDPANAAANSLAAASEYVPIKLSAASCYKCHQTTLSAGQYSLTSVPPIRGQYAGDTTREQIFQFLRGQSYPIKISGPVLADTNGAYTAQISAATNPAGFVLDDPHGILGTAMAVSNLTGKAATLIVPKVTLTAPATVDWNNNFDEGKTAGGQRVPDSADPSPYSVAWQIKLTQHGTMQISITPNITNLYAHAVVTLSKNYDGLATNADHGDIRIIALNATNGWREIPFDVDVCSYFSPAGSNSGYNQFYVEGLGLGTVKLQAKLGGEVYAEQAVEVCTHQDKAFWSGQVRDEIFSDTSGTVAIENYLASNGFMNNRTNILGVYGFYEKLFAERPTQFYWAGLAKLAGAPVYAGLSDAENLHNLGFVTIPLNPVIGTEVGIFGRLYYAVVFQQTLIQMNVNIYNDLAWQFEAYRMGGLCALENVAANGLNVVDILPWRKINQGIRENDASLIQSGNQDLLKREQQKVLADGYTQLSKLPKATSLMTQLAKNPVPGGPTFISIIPNGNIANFPDRWTWITTNSVGMWPLWLSNSQATQLQWVQIPLKTRAADYSIGNDWHISFLLPIK